MPNTSILFDKISLSADAVQRHVQDKCKLNVSSHNSSLSHMPQNETVLCHAQRIVIFPRIGFRATVSASIWDNRNNCYATIRVRNWRKRQLNEVDMIKYRWVFGLDEDDVSIRVWLSTHNWAGNITILAGIRIVNWKRYIDTSKVTINKHFQVVIIRFCNMTSLFKL